MLLGFCQIQLSLHRFCKRKGVFQHFFSFAMVINPLGHCVYHKDAKNRTGALSLQVYIWCGICSVGDQILLVLGHFSIKIHLSVFFNAGIGPK